VAGKKRRSFFYPVFFRVSTLSVLLSAVPCRAVGITTFGTDSIALEPGRMGPNALPVPFMYPTKVGTAWRLEVMTECHYDPRGDMTVNPFFSVFVPIHPIAAFTVFSRPGEYFRTTDEMQMKRHAEDNSGFTRGDLYFQGMLHPVSYERGGLFDAAFHLTLKTTTGKGLENARHINAPAYFFDWTFARPIFQAGSLDIIARALIAFCAWQVNVNEQNDAVGYGIQFEFSKPSFRFTIDGAGYYGWINNGDRPAVVRGRFSRRVGKNLEFFTGGHIGMSDQSLLRVEIGGQLRFKFRTPNAQHALRRCERGQRSDTGCRRTRNRRKCPM